MRIQLYFLIWLFLIALLLLLAPLPAAAAAWSDPFKLGAGDSRPAVALDSQNNLHLTWASSKNKAVYYRKCSRLAEANCSAVEQVPTNGKPSYFPAIAIDSTDQPHIVWESKTGSSFAIFWARRADNGWQSYRRISNESFSEHPAIAIGPDGIVHVVYQAKSSKTGFVYYTSFQDGSSVSSTALIDQVNTATPLPTLAEQSPEGDPESEPFWYGFFPRVAVDHNGLAHVVWNTPDLDRVWYAFQNDQKMFVNKVVVSSGHGDRQPDVATNAVLDQVGIVWQTHTDRDLGLALFSNGTRTSRWYKINPRLNSARPRLAADCAGQFHTVFEGKPGNADHWQIYHQIYDPHLHSLRARQEVAGGKTNQRVPSIAASNLAVILYANADRGTILARSADLGFSCPPAPPPPPDPTTNTHFPETDPRIQYNNAWQLLGAKSASDRAYARCGERRRCRAGSSAELTFTGGRRIEWETAYANNYGLADVYIDGQLFERVDLCRPRPDSRTPRFGVRTYILTGDATTVHQIKIVALGKDSNCSPYNTNYVAVDGFNIIR